MGLGFRVQGLGAWGSWVSGLGFGKFDVFGV